MSLACKPDLESVLTRLRSLYACQGEDRIFATMDVPSAALARFAQVYAHGECDYPDPVQRACLDERPDMVRRAIDFAFDLNVRVQQAFFETVPSVEGGTLSNFAQWLPGRIVSESIDPCHMTSVAYFERWGREPAERIMNRFDGGVIHIHGNGRHLLEAAATLRGLKAVLLLDDRGFPAAFDVIEELKARVGDVPVSLFAPYEAFVDRLRRRALPGGVLYQVRGVPGVSSANRCMEEVRAYRT